jgi:hypothetical protein
VGRGRRVGGAVPQPRQAQAHSRSLRLRPPRLGGAGGASLPDEEKAVLRRAVEVAERFADGKATKRELAACRFDDLLERYEVDPDGCAAAACLYCAGDPVNACEGSHRAAQAGAFLKEPRGSGWSSWHRGYRREAAAQCALLREIVGNPFRPARFEPAWRTPDAAALAGAAYAERALPSGELDLARLKVLADALEEAGCDQAELLAHLRSKGPHVRGCRALDLALGKK